MDRDETGNIENELYQWAARTATDFHGFDLDNYLIPPEIQRLDSRLSRAQGQLIAVIGLQGIGKTTAFHYLSHHLTGSTPVKWRGVNQVIKILTEDLREEADFFDDEKRTNLIIDAFCLRNGIKNDEYLDILSVLQKTMKKEYRDNFWEIISSSIQVYCDWKQGRKMDEFLANSMKRSIQRHVIPFAIDKIGKDNIPELVAERKLLGVKTFLVEFPDYDKKSRSKQLQDLSSFQKFIQEFIFDHESDSFSPQLPNIVVFWQDELWKNDHFIHGKYSVVRLRPFRPEELTNYYIRRFSGPDPFTRDSLVLLASLARGIFRWFMKYIRVCLDNRAYEDIDIVGTDMVTRWITLEQLLEDWNRELMSVFPRNVGNRRTSIRVFQYLQENGRTSQSTIQEIFFEPKGSGETACSRFLSKLEDYGYIIREYDGREKYVELSSWG